MHQRALLEGVARAQCEYAHFTLFRKQTSLDDYQPKDPFFAAANLQLSASPSPNTSSSPTTQNLQPGSGGTVAERVNLTKSPCLKRLRRLEKDGFIRGYRADIDQHKVDLVNRERLIALLDAAVDKKITFVVAPAGFGKSKLLCQWFEQKSADDMVMAWLMLDENDTDAHQFLSYAVMSLAHGGVDIGELEIGARNGFLESPPRSILTA
jgi:DNA-binding Lrp family transcriptional regulator